MLGVEALVHAGSADLSDAALAQVLLAALATFVRPLATAVTPALFAAACEAVKFKA